MRKVVVRYMIFPSIEQGVSGFYEHENDKRCIDPSKPYKSGVCHTVGEELDELAGKVGFITREEFASEFNSQYWKNAYGQELSTFVGKALESKGIVMNINGEDVLFQCPENEFVTWQVRKHK